ncbi:hypothetical protein COV24_03175 [candidate division WWE3 bacterium CG10_big_fil_rev_8_21_14_0_10_32_10]|uniref:Uncharacterized protein n=1 Tax=candidate division WWE3 bacterium CG10_big_fil_rev_8_21_14_0_10_32_10 TaxID=1975090 RepID=A0A2H0R9X8_UNCKA|nr:MAG: hypothetical protein COV24_03175 [candidate division WWE3 bacterium CG10_big_fil_rev_8_21_14_0_10_32_10]
MAKNKENKHVQTEISKPILQFSVLCDGVANQGNKPVFIGVFSNFVRTGIIAQFFIANRWTYGKGTFKQKTAIKDPDLKKIVAEIPEQEFVLKEETNGADIINGFVNVNFKKPGVYWVEIFLDGELVMSYPLPVYQQQK